MGHTCFCPLSNPAQWEVLARGGRCGQLDADMLDALSVGWPNELSESGSAVSNDFVPQEGVSETPVDPTVPWNGELPVNPGQSPYQQPYFAAQTPAPAPPKRPRA